MKAERTVEYIYKKKGIGGMYGELIPIVFKQDIVVEAGVTVEAGTLAWIDDTRECFIRNIIGGRKTYTLYVYFPTYNEDMQRDYCTFPCIVDFDKGELVVEAGEQLVPFVELFETPGNSGISGKLRELDETMVQYSEISNSKNKLYRNTAILGSLTLALLIFLLSLYRVMVGLIPSTVFIGGVLFALICVGGYYAVSCYYYRTRLNQCRGNIKQLCDWLQAMDMMYVEKYHRDK